MKNIKQIIKEEIKKLFIENSVSPNAVMNNIKSFKKELDSLNVKLDNLNKSKSKFIENNRPKVKEFSINRRKLQSEMEDDDNVNSETGLGSSYGDVDYYVNELEKIDKFISRYENKIKYYELKEKELKSQIKDLNTKIKSNEDSLKTSLKSKKTKMNEERKFHRKIINNPVDGDNYTGVDVEYKQYSPDEKGVLLFRPHRPKAGEWVYVEIFDGQEKYVELESDINQKGRGSYRDEDSGLEEELKIVVDKDSDGNAITIKFVDVHSYERFRFR